MGSPVAVMGQRESASIVTAAAPETVFHLVTDPLELPSWNRAITSVVDAPPHLSIGSEWKVRMHTLGQSWVSRSRVSALDATTHRFAYRSQSDDGNPSYADWEWQVDDGEGDATVTVTVDLNPATFWRRHLLVRIRRRSLRLEIIESLRALNAAATAPPADHSVL